MNKIPTWEDMESSGEYDDYGQMAREFAKLHVQAALKAAAEQADKAFIGNRNEYKQKIIDIYPLNNIQ